MSTPSIPRAIEAASLAGMALGVGAYSLFAVHDALVKSLIMDLPALQILFTRSLVIATLALALGRKAMVSNLIASPNKKFMLFRALLTLSAWGMYYSAGRELKLAEMTTLYYFAPVLTIVLAVIFLKEQVTLARVAASAIGFFGVIVACNPANFTVGLPTIMVLVAALFWAIAMILMRTISKSESSLSQIFFMNSFNVILLGAISLPMWHGMDMRQITIALATGIVGGVGQYILIEAARRLPASVLGTVEYSALIWSFIFGYLFWREEPAQTVYVGAAMLIAAGIVLAWSERRNRREIIDTP